LSMAFWLSGGKPHIVVAWVGSAVMGLALVQGVITLAPSEVWAPPSVAPPYSPPAPPYSPPPGVTVAHALALVATGIMLWLSLVASDLNGSSFGFILVLGSPFVLALPLALQLEMPQLVFQMEVVVCIAAAGCGLYVLSTSSSMPYLPIRTIETTLPLKGASASLALLVTALNALIPAAAVYTLLPLVWAVGSGYAISGWLACEKEGVGEKDARSFFGLALTVVRSVVTLPLAVLPWVEAMPGWLKETLSYAGTAMALLHLSMAFWLSGGKPHIVVAWVGSAVMGLALVQGVITLAPSESLYPLLWKPSLSPQFPQPPTSLRSHLTFLAPSLSLAPVFVLIYIFFPKKLLLAVRALMLPKRAQQALPEPEPLPRPSLAPTSRIGEDVLVVGNRVTWAAPAVNTRVSNCCPCPCWPAAAAAPIEGNLTA